MTTDAPESALAETVETAPPKAEAKKVIVAQHSPDVTHFQVRNGYNWASVYVRSIVRREQVGATLDDARTRCGVEVMINSDLGLYGHHWQDIGKEGWESFLISLSFEYAMRKLAGKRYNIEPTVEQHAHYYREMAKDHFKDELAEIDPEDDFYAERLADQQKAKDDYNFILRAIEETLEDDELHPSQFFREMDREAGGRPYNLGWWEGTLEVVDPEIREFWERLWVPFTAFLEQQWKDRLQKEWKDKVIA